MANYLLAFHGGGMPQTEAEQATVMKANDRYRPGQRRRIGELEWAGLLRLAERKYPGFRD